MITDCQDPVQMQAVCSDTCFVGVTHRTEPSSPAPPHPSSPLRPRPHLSRAMIPPSRSPPPPRCAARGTGLGSRQRLAARARASPGSSAHRRPVRTKEARSEPARLTWCKHAESLRFAKAVCVARRCRCSTRSAALPPPRPSCPAGAGSPPGWPSPLPSSRAVGTGTSRRSTPEATPAPLRKTAKHLTLTGQKIAARAKAEPQPT